MPNHSTVRPRLAPLEDRVTPAVAYFDLGYGAGGLAPLTGLFGVTGVTAVAVQPDGSVLIAGTTSDALAALDIGVVKLTPTGQRDVTFGTNGLAVVAFDLAGPGKGDDTPFALAVRPDGRIVVAGSAATRADVVGGPARVAVARLTAAGQLDPTFDGDGRLTFPLDPTAADYADRATEVAAQADGSTLVLVAQAAGLAAVRLTASGAIDPGYGAGGTAVLGAGVQDATVDPTGRVLAVRLEAGAPPPPSGGTTLTAIVTRLTAAGQPDAGYGSGGQAVAGTLTTNNGSVRGYSAGLVALADGSALVAADTQIGSVRQRQSVVSRLDPVGRLDPLFGGDGTTTEVEGTTIRERADGSLVGQPTGGLSSPPAVAIGRTADGDPDPAFGANGTIDTATAPSDFLGLNRLTPAATGTAVYALSTRPVDSNRRETGVVRLLPAGNQLPTVTGLPTGTVTLRAGETTTFPLTVADLDGSANDVTVTASSSSSGVLFLPGGLSVTGTGANRTLVLTPAAGQREFGSALVTVRDALGGTATASFSVQSQTLPAALGGTRRFAAGPGAGGGPTATLFDPDGTPVRSLSVFQPGATGGVRVAVADLVIAANDGTPDRVPDLIVGTGPGTASRVEVYDGRTFARVFSTDPFEASFTGGVFVAVGDLDGDGVPDLVVTADQGGGPRVRVFRGGDFRQVADFFGIDDPGFRGGARPAVGDVTGDGRGDLIIAAGFGGGPRVAVYDGTSLGGGAFARKPFGDFFAFEDTLRNGVFVAAGDLTADGKAEVVVGAGPGGGPRVSAFSGADLLAGRQTRVADFFAGDPADRSGVRVAVKDLDGDGRADVVAGVGGRVAGFFGRTLTSGAAPAFTLDPFPGALGGVFVG